MGILEAYPSQTINTLGTFVLVVSNSYKCLLWNTFGVQLYVATAVFADHTLMLVGVYPLLAFALRITAEHMSGKHCK